MVLRRSLPVSLIRWVSPPNIHLTLKFLGDITPGAVDLLIPALEREISIHHPIDVAVSGFGAFPAPLRARVLWVGLQAPLSLVDLHRSVDGITTQLSLGNREERFSPHLTIGRVKRDASSMELKTIAANLQQAEKTNLGNFRIESITIFKSDLRSTGPVYSRLHSISLAGS